MTRSGWQVSRLVPPPGWCSSTENATSVMPQYGGSSNAMPRGSLSLRHCSQQPPVPCWGEQWRGWTLTETRTVSCSLTTRAYICDQRLCSVPSGILGFPTRCLQSACLSLVRYGTLSIALSHGIGIVGSVVAPPVWSRRLDSRDDFWMRRRRPRGSKRNGFRHPQAETRRARSVACRSRKDENRRCPLGEKR